MPGEGRLYLSCLESIRNSRIIVLQWLKKACDALGEIKESTHVKPLP